MKYISIFMQSAPASCIKMNLHIKCTIVLFVYFSAPSFSSRTTFNQSITVRFMVQIEDLLKPVNITFPHHADWFLITLQLLLAQVQHVHPLVPTGGVFLCFFHFSFSQMHVYLFRHIQTESDFYGCLLDRSA